MKMRFRFVALYFSVGVLYFAYENRRDDEDREGGGKKEGNEKGE